MNSRSLYLFLSGIIITGAFIFSFICYPTPIGNFWWDWISLLGASKAISQGLMPFRDFWTTLFYPLIELKIILDIAGIDRAFLVTHFIHLFLSIVFLSFFVFGVFSKVEIIILLFGTSLMSFVPINISHMAGGVFPAYMADIGIPNYNAHYNRFNNALLLIAYIGFYPNKLIPRAFKNFYIKKRNLIFYYNRGFILALLAIILFLSKITVFFVLLGLYLYRLITSQKSRYLVIENIAIVILFILPLYLIEFRYGIISQYLSATNQIAKIKSDRFMDDLLLVRIPWILYFHGAELIFLFINISIIFNYGYKKYQHSLILYHYKIHSIYDNFIILKNSMLIPLYISIFIAGSAILIVTNYGDYGLLPIHLVLIATISKIAREDKIFYQGSLVNKFPKFYFVNFIRVTTIFPLVIYFYFIFATSAQMIYNSLLGRLVPVATGVPYIDKNFVITPEIKTKLNNLSLATVKFDKKEFFFKPEYFVLLAHSYGDLYQILNKYYPNYNTEVEMLSLTSFALSVIAEYRVPRGAYSWLHINHEILPSAPPPLSQITGRASLIIIDLCDLNLSNRLGLAPLFKGELDKYFILTHESTCWQIYERHSPYKI